MTDREIRSTRLARRHREEIPWTVTRCNRLLRSISSRIATIRRLIENFDTGNTKPCKQAPSERPVESPVVPSRERASSNAFLAYEQSPRAHDPDWMPQGDKIASRTYGGRRKVRHAEGPAEQTSHCGSTAALRTPFLRKLLRPNATISPITQPALKRADRGPKKSKQLPIKPNTSLDEAHRSLISAFGQFLSNTAPPTLQARRGTSSFRAMCLRQVPQYIEAEQAWRLEEDKDEDADATSETYSLLESLGHGDVAGHADLREIVRAHGVRMICWLIEEGLLGDGVVHELLDTCKNAKATTEGHSIMLSWAQAISENRAFVCSRRLGLLVDSSLKLDSDGLRFTLRYLTRLLNGGKIAQSQLDGMNRVWHPMLYMLADATSRLDVMCFLEAYFQTPPEKPSQTSTGSDNRQDGFLWNLAALLTAMTWMQMHGNTTSQCDLSPSAQLQSLLQCIHRTKDCNSSLDKMRPFVLASLLSSSIHQEIVGIRTQMSVDIMLEMLLQDKSPKKSSKDSDFLPEVARVIGHIDRNLAFDMLKSVSVNLATISLTQSDTAKIAYLKRLAIDGGRNWAEDQDDMESFDWAEGLDELFYQSDVKLQEMRTPMSRKPTKYRWEAGMCEWIRATPFVAAKQREQKRSESVSSDDFYDSGICISSDGKTRKRSRSSPDVEEDEDLDLEDRDELSMATPELNKLIEQRNLREQRTRKAPKMQSGATGKENAMLIARGTQRCVGLEPARWNIDDMSEDELGM